MVLLFEIWLKRDWYIIFIYLHCGFIILYVAMWLVCKDLKNKWGNWLKVELFLVCVVGFSISYGIVMLWYLGQKQPFLGVSKSAFVCFCLCLSLFG